MTPSSQTALVVNEAGSVDVKRVEVPEAGENEVLIKVVAAALNPTDCASFTARYISEHGSPYTGKSAKWQTKPGVVSGCDFAGTVEVLGAGAESTGLKGEYSEASSTYFL